jgi:CSLREA domain-containing protein
LLGSIRATGAERGGAASTEAKRRTADLLQFTSGGHVLGFEPKGIHVATGSHALRVEFVNATGTPTSDAEASDRRSQSAPNDPPKAVALSRVTYANLWPGVTLSYDAPGGGIARSTYRVEPKASPESIRLRYNAAVSVQSDGSLLIPFKTGTMRETAPVAWQERAGIYVPVQVAFMQRGESEIAFTLGDYDRSLPLFIDPTLTWNTFFGGSGDDFGEGLAVDGSGNVYVAGESTATWGSPVRAYSGGAAYDAFAAKLDSSGNLLWNTFLGGTGGDFGHALAVDGSGNVYVIGESSVAWGSPVQAFGGGFIDAFAAKLDSSGNLIWNTFLGGSGTDGGNGIAVDGNGNVYVAGYSNATWGSPVRALSGIGDVFAAKLDSSGNLTWNTFLGGSGDDGGNGIAVDGNGNVYVTGYSTATWGSPVRAYTSGIDGFAAKMDSSGSLLWNTFLGGSGGDFGKGIAMDGSGNVYVAGYSDATWGSPVGAYSSGNDGSVAKLDSSGNLLWNTFLGGSGSDFGNRIAVDGSGNAYVTGNSNATWDLPVRAYTSGFDAFAAKLNSSGTLTWNTFLGGTGSDDESGAVAVDGSGNVYVTGYSNATWGSPVGAYNGGYDAFVAKLSPPSTAYVDANWAGTAPGADPDGLGPASSFGSDSFATIQDGINGVATGGTVQVHSGTYTENVDATTKAVSLSAGASPGQVTINGDLILDSDDTLPIEINGTNATTDYDNFTVNGGVTLGSATLTLSGTHTPVNGESFEIVANDALDAVSGTFAGRPQGSVITNFLGSGLNARISYTGDTGNDVVLTVEPPFSVSSTSPTDGATGIARNTSISVTLNRAANVSSITTNTVDTSCSGTLQVSRAADNFTTCVQMAASPVASGGDTTFTVTPAAALAGATTYRIRVTTGAQDSGGLALGTQFDQATGFTTKAALAVTATNPADGASVSADTTVSVTFNVAANPASLTTNTANTSCSGSFQVSGDNFSTCVQMAGAPVASGGNTVFTITPAAPLSTGITYRIRITTGATDADGAPLGAQFTQATGWTVTPGAATHFAVVAPADATAGTAFDFTVTALDQFNNTATGYAGTVHFTSTDTNASLPVDSTLISGTGTFSATLKTAGNQTITATDTTTSSITGTSGAINVAAAGASKLAFAQQPMNTAANSSITPAVTVQIQDPFGNLTSSTASVTVAIGTNPGGGTLSGTTSVNAVSGVATFSNLSIDKAGTGYTLAASSGSLTGVTSSTFNITPGAADHLEFLQQPTDTAAGSTITPAVTVQIKDQSGNLTSSTASVSIAIGSNPSGGTLSGTTTVAAINGTATFNDLSINYAGTGYTLTASSGSLTGATSSAFNVTCLGPQTVTNTNDSGTGSLRDAIANACAGDPIDFNIPGPAPHIIGLTSGELTIDKNVTITGPGLDVVTVQRTSGSFRIFTINPGKTVAISGLTISNGNAPGDDGGGIVNSGSLTLDFCNVTGNSADYAGGIFNDNNSTLTIRGSSITGNHASFVCAGIYNRSGATLTIVDSTISGNSADQNSGGILNEGGTLRMFNSTVSGNSCKGDGGGVYNYVNGTSMLTNVTITQNRADSDGVGGGVAGGLYVPSGTVTSRNTIVAGNFVGTGTTASDVSGPLAPSSAYNLIGGDPLLGPLRNNGGATFTHAPDPGSPAIDQGAAAVDQNNNPLTIDQRGSTRPIRYRDTIGLPPGGNASDIGAVELTVPPVCTPPPGGMVSWWPGDGNTTDIQGGNNGTWQGTPSYGAGEVAAAFNFSSANNNRVERSGGGSLDLTGKELTLDGWIYPRTNTTAFYFGKSAPSDHPYIVYFDAGTGHINIITKTTGGQLQYDTGYTPALNTWTHLALVYDGQTSNTVKLYANGTQVFSNSQSGNLISSPGVPFVIGNRTSGDFNSFNGLIDEVEVFGRSLPASDIQAIYSAGAAGKCKPCTTPPGNMISWWSGDGHPNDIQDGNNLTWINTPAYGTGVVGQAFNFNGQTVANSANWVQANAAGNLNITGNQLTLDGWIYPRTNTSGTFYFAKSADSDHPYVVFFSGSTIQLIISTVGGDNQQFNTLYTPPTNTWTHLAMVYASPTLQLYVNGVSVFSVDLTVPGSLRSSTIPFAIGNRATNPSTSFDGLIDEVEVFGRALLPGEVQAIYAAQSSGKCKPPPVVQFSSNTFGPYSEGVGNATLTVTRTGDISITSTVAYSKTNVSTTNGDFTGTTSGVVSFAAGEASKDISIGINDDSTYEGTESFTVALSAPSVGTIGAQGSASVSITDNDTAPTLSINDPPAVTEGGDVVFTVTQSAATELETSFEYSTADGTAKAPGDYTAVTTATGLGTIPAGETTTTITIGTNNDTIYEGGNETFTVTLSDPPTNATIADGTGTGTIQDNDTQPTISINDVTQIEGNGPGTTGFLFTVSLSNPSYQTITVNYATQDGTTNPATAGSDYVAIATTPLTFNPGETSQTVTVLVNGDTTHEADETFFVNLTNPSNVTSGDMQGLGTITNDDPLPAISINDATPQNEGNTHDPGNTPDETNHTFTVSLANPSDQTITVDYATANGSATAGSDYVAISTTTLTFNPGETSKPVVVVVKGDKIYEANEKFYVNLSNASPNATINDGQGEGTILNDDDPPTLSINDRSNNEGTIPGPTASPTPTPLPYTTMTFTVTKAGSTALNATVKFATANGTAIGNTNPCPSGDDYQSQSDGTLTFLPNETTKQITVSVCKDSAYEANETFFVNLSTPVDATLTDDQGQGTILNDDIPTGGFTVNTTDDLDDTVCDATHCSLREAILAANNSSSVVAIRFDIPADDHNNLAGPPRHSYYADDGVQGQVSLAKVRTTTASDDTALVGIPVDPIDPDWLHSWWSILPTSPLPAAAKEVFIDGYSQTGAFANTVTTGTTGTNAVLRVELNGTSASSNATGLTIAGGTSTVRGLVINRFQRDGLAPTPAGDGLKLSSGKNTVSGNFIGTDVSGMLNVASPSSGSGILTTSFNNIIGGSTPEVVNLIAGNVGAGITLSNSNTNTIRGNLIGTKFDGASPLGNGGSGLDLIGAGSVANIIGGTDPGEGNTIAFNGSDGVGLNTAGFGNAIRGNSIFSNGTTSLDLGIDLGSDGVTPNDLPAQKDADTGPNDLQNFPVITVARVTGSTKTIIGSLDSKDGETFDIDFYANTSCDTTLGNGEGQTYLGSVTTAATDGSGHVVFTFHPDSHAAEMVAGKFITATATSTGAIFNTSEFSKCFQVVDGSPEKGDIQFTSATYTIGEAGGTAAITVTRVNGTNGSVTANLSTSNGTAVAPGDYTAITNFPIPYVEGETGTKTVNITINNDNIYETNETVNLSLSSTQINSPNRVDSAPNQAVNPHAAVLTIVDNDSPPSFAINDVSHNEGNSGTTGYVFTVTKTGASEITASVKFQAQDGSATQEENDYQAASGTLTFTSAGPLSQQVTVLVNGDTAFETDETFTVHLSNVVNATISRADGTGTILNDDAEPTPTPTPTPTATATATATATPTATATATPTATATATPAATPTATPTATPARALNISTRLRVETGDNAMIAGFIITGNSSKPVVVRGIGPSLTSFGLSDLLLDPILELRGSNGSLILRNDNWKDDQRSQIEGTVFQPGDDRESVILATLTPANYTAILTGKNNTTGVGVVEAYDTNQALDSQLGNISTRGFVQAGNNVMIGGFILGGSQTNARVALRGIGPSLSQFGLNNVLADPTLEVRDANGALLLANDNWTDDPVSAAQLTANGLALSDQKESGIFTSLPPGQFTAILAGKNGGVGIGLVEIYNVK